MTKLPNPINVYEPAKYIIELQGRLDPIWSSSFDGMTMTYRTSTGGFTVTTLYGIVTDQSSLHGILNHIRDLGLPLLFVECLSAREIEL
ncbi:MAG: hypothetical protein EHM41_24610 [Chloroflexi bacterium]|nr:MAG: hypothetical protein EHM41_24610 [Chloroflexota bacterium]